jgi:hypothetical protein
MGYFHSTSVWGMCTNERVDLRGKVDGEWLDFGDGDEFSSLIEFGSLRPPGCIASGHPVSLKPSARIAGRCSLISNLEASNLLYHGLVFYGMK